jgi:hypothetical protein
MLWVPVLEARLGFVPCVSLSSTAYTRALVPHPDPSEVTIQARTRLAKPKVSDHLLSQEL